MAQQSVVLSGRRKAAVLCLALGPEPSASVLKRLPAEAAERLAVEIARAGHVEPETVESVLEEMIGLVSARGYLVTGGLNFAREVLKRAVGEKRAQEILMRLAGTIEKKPFEFLRDIPADQIAVFLRGEHPQTVALVIANLPTTDQAAAVIRLLPGAEQADVAMRIALMEKTVPGVVKEVARVMKEKIETIPRREYAGAGGAPALAKILNASNRGTERNVLSHLDERDPEVAQEVRELLFVFEDILKLDDRSIQIVLKEVDTRDIALALRGSTDELRERIMRNMSKRGAEMLAEDMEYMPPQRKVVVEQAQSKIVEVIRRLDETNAIQILRGEEESETLL